MGIFVCCIIGGMSLCSGTRAGNSGCCVYRVACCRPCLGWNIGIWPGSSTGLFWSAIYRCSRQWTVFCRYSIPIRRNSIVLPAHPWNRWRKVIKKLHLRVGMQLLLPGMIRVRNAIHRGQNEYADKDRIQKKTEYRKRQRAMYTAEWYQYVYMALNKKSEPPVGNVQCHRVAAGNHCKHNGVNQCAKINFSCFQV